MRERSLLSDNIKKINEKIGNAAVKSGRDLSDITLIAVTKTVDIESINEAISNGIKHIGENRVQEFSEKNSQLLPCKKHMIGTLQSNKVNKIVGQVDLIQSVNSVRLASEIGKQSRRLCIVSDILLEINIGNEQSKTGADILKTDEMLDEISKIEGVFVKGIMTIAPICDKSKDLLKFFYNMHQLFIDIGRKKRDNVVMDFLSMGMSGDFEEAVLSGSNMVRIGSALFGGRNI